MELLLSETHQINKGPHSGNSLELPLELVVFSTPLSKGNI